MQKLGDAGFHVVFVPEAATLLLESGIKPDGKLLSGNAFQDAVIDLILKLETSLEQTTALLDHPNPVIICDRGLMDGHAYVAQPAEFTRRLAERGLTVVEARDSRYQGVFHLRTAASGAEEYYTLGNNVVRTESPEEARRLDERTLGAWTGHPHLRIIPNVGTFEQKLKHLLAEVCILLGIPQPVEIERKFLIEKDRARGWGCIPSAHEVVDIEQFYLRSSDPDEEVRFRKRGQNGSWTYFKTVKHPGTDDASRIETESFITSDQYDFGRQFRIPGTRVVVKKRICFVYQEQYFELDVFGDPPLDEWLLELELAHSGQAISLPPFLSVVREVTSDLRYTNRALAAI
jgi:CYTH domain-containing protein